MSQVAGSLRLDLAQFRELEAFAQFSSDLDKATKARIERGRHLLEIFKQPQFRPVPVEKQIIIIYAATNGFVDDVPLDKVAEWETSFYRFLDGNYQDLQNEVIESSVIGRSKMSPDLMKKLSAAIEDFKKTAAPQAEQ